MNQSKIENAACEYQMTLPYCDDPKTRGMFIGGYDGFIAGAKWAINSLWHKAEDAPSRYDTYLVHTRQGCVFIALYDLHGWHTDKGGDIMEWCDIKDLLP